MRKYIHLFKTSAEFQAMYNDDDKYIEPWVSYTRENDSCKYNKSESERLLGTQLTFKITSAGDIKWKANNSSLTKEIQYSKNGGEWTSVTSTTAGESISVVVGDTVKFKSSVFPAANSFSGTTAGFELEGNVMSLGGGSSFASLTEITQVSAFTNLFQSCTGLTDASKLLLPATTLANYCYGNMFYGCTSLTTVPVLPATTLANSCYYSMFNGCTNLTTATTILPATTLAERCYQAMFVNCTSLTTVPVLPATTLVNSCYTSMFQGCTSLTAAPELPATTLTGSCYSYMFYGCTNLNYVKAMFTTTPSTSYTSNWVSGVALTGTFVKNSAATWNVTGVNGVPTGWTVETAAQ